MDSCKLVLFSCDRWGASRLEMSWNASKTPLRSRKTVNSLAFTVRDKTTGLKDGCDVTNDA